MLLLGRPGRHNRVARPMCMGHPRSVPRRTPDEFCRTCYGADVAVSPAVTHSLRPNLVAALLATIVAASALVTADATAVSSAAVVAAISRSPASKCALQKHQPALEGRAALGRRRETLERSHRPALLGEYARRERLELVEFVGLLIAAGKGSDTTCAFSTDRVGGTHELRAGQRFRLSTLDASRCRQAQYCGEHRGPGNVCAPAQEAR